MLGKIHRLRARGTFLEELVGTTEPQEPLARWTKKLAPTKNGKRTKKPAELKWALLRTLGTTIK